MREKPRSLPALLLIFWATALLPASVARAEQDAGAAAGDVAQEGDAAPAEGTLQGLRWELAPLRWGGTLGNVFRWARADGQPDRYEVVQSASLRGASYIWQPWFAQVSGSVGFVTSKMTVSGPNTLPGDTGGRITNPTGNGNLALFPLSRFPFTAYFDLSDSRNSATLTRNDYTTSRFGVRQSYRTESGNTQMSASYDRSAIESTFYGKDTVNALNGTMSTVFNNHRLELTGQHTKTTRTFGGEGSQFGYLLARHTLRPDEYFSLESFASLSNSDIRYNNLGIINRNQARYLQANSFATWRPEADWPVYVTGGARYLSYVTDYGLGQTDSQSVSANIGATVNYSPNLTLTGAATIASLNARTSGYNGMVTTQSAGANYVSNPIQLGGFNYYWNAGGTISNQTGLDSGSGIAAYLQFGHSVSRDIPLWTGASSLFASQSAYVSTSAQFGQSTTLVHNLGLSYRVNPTDVLSGFASVNFSDTRTSGENETEYQNVMGQINGQWQISPRSSFSANLSLQWNRQGTVAGVLPGTTLPGQDTFTAYGNASYQHTRAFGIPGLRYLALYTINTLKYDARLYGDFTAEPRLFGQSLEQRLDWRFGRLDMRLSTIFAQQNDGKKNALIFFETRREFGTF